MELSMVSKPQSLFDEDCPHCTDGWLLIVGQGVKPCACRKRRQRERALSVIPTIYRSFSLDTITPDEARHPKQAALIAAMRATPQATFAFLGNPGSGKTLLAWLLYRRAVEDGRRAVGLTVADLLSQFRSWELNPDQLPAIKPEDLRGRKDGDLPTCLMLDDADKPRPTEFAGEMMFELLNAAYSFGHQIVITSNLDSKGLSAHWERSGHSRGAVILRRVIESSGAVLANLF